jgi:hypothetical protein
MGGRDLASAVRDELSPQREQALLEAVLRHQVVMDPRPSAPTIRLLVLLRLAGTAAFTVGHCVGRTVRGVWLRM